MELIRKVKRVVRRTVGGNGPMEVKVGEVTPIHFRKIDYPKKRINILLPSINPEHVFGGIATAYKFFELLVKETQYDCRIILVDAKPSSVAIVNYGKEYAFVDASEDSTEAKQVVAFSDREGRTIPVSDNDIFILTGWWTAYCIQAEYHNWIGKDLKVHPFLYFIQDYEPGFYPWSTRYMLADSTYRTEFDQIAIFNSKELKAYFDKWEYHFEKSYVFNPVLNDGLKKELLKLDKTISKEKQILVYGRPNTDRNAFELLIEALRRWVEIQEDVEEWTVLSAGEAHNKVDLGKGKYLESIGKLPIEEYAHMLERTYAGVSLMVSPHPSYPPLEMSVFGAKVITNTYANKNLSSFNENMISVKNCSPYTIADELRAICNQFIGVGTTMVDVNDEYCNGKELFPFMKELVEGWEK